jgi:Uma2 family endonuclease
MRRANVRFNYRDYLLLPEEKRYEILEGELFVVPAPNIRHQRLCRDLLDFLLHHTRERMLGEVLSAPCDVVLSDENVVQPDILYIRNERLGIIGEANVSGPPDLVVEVLSPASRGRDLEIKRKIYAAFGVQEYWVVDPDAATVEVLSLGERGYASCGVYGRLQHLTSPLLPDLDLALSEIFNG